MLLGTTLYYSRSNLLKAYGKIINRRHYDRVCNLIDKDKVVFGGKCDEASLRIEPTILDNVASEDAVMAEDIFEFININMKLRPFNITDAPTILSWTKNKSEFRKWSADRYPDYPATPEDMANQYHANNIHPLTAEDEDGNIIGHIMVRIPNSATPQNVRLGFIIVDDSLRGKGYGKQLVLQAIDYAKQNLNATHVSLGVFLNNPSALHCYESVGFKAIGTESYPIDGETWEGVEMEYI